MNPLISADAQRNCISDTGTASPSGAQLTLKNVWLNKWKDINTNSNENEVIYLNVKLWNTRRLDAEANNVWIQ